MTYPTLVLSSSSSFLVSLIVFLRFLSIKRPIGFENTHKRVSHIGSITIWSFCLLVPSTIFVLTVPGIYDPNIYFMAIGVQVHVIYTFPIVTTVIIYGILLYTLNKHSDTAMSEVTNRRLRSISRLMKSWWTWISGAKLLRHIRYLHNIIEIVRKTNIEKRDRENSRENETISWLFFFPWYAWKSRCFKGIFFQGDDRRPHFRIFYLFSLILKGCSTSISLKALFNSIANCTCNFPISVCILVTFIGVRLWKWCLKCVRTF